MRLRAIGYGLVCGSACLAAGCVERRFVVESVPPGAKVYVNDRPVGFSPVDVPFDYYGKYNIRLERDGYQTETFPWRIRAPWYAYPPFDFLSENIYPGKIRDIRRETFEMKPVAPPNPEEIQLDAEELRQRGRALPDPKKPVEPRRPTPSPGAQP